MEEEKFIFELTKDQLTIQMKTLDIALKVGGLNNLKEVVELFNIFSVLNKKVENSTKTTEELTDMS